MSRTWFAPNRRHDTYRPSDPYKNEGGGAQSPSSRRPSFDPPRQISRTNTSRSEAMPSPTTPAGPPLLSVLHDFANSIERVGAIRSKQEAHQSKVNERSASYANHYKHREAFAILFEDAENQASKDEQTTKELARQRERVDKEQRAVADRLAEGIQAGRPTQTSTSHASDAKVLGRIDRCEELCNTTFTRYRSDNDSLRQAAMTKEDIERQILAHISREQSKHQKLEETGIKENEHLRRTVATQQEVIDKQNTKLESFGQQLNEFKQQSADREAALKETLNQLREDDLNARDAELSQIRTLEFHSSSHETSLQCLEVKANMLSEQMDQAVSRLKDANIPYPTAVPRTSDPADRNGTFNIFREELNQVGKIVQDLDTEFSSKLAKHEDGVEKLRQEVKALSAQPPPTASGRAPANPATPVLVQPDTADISIYHLRLIERDNYRISKEQEANVARFQALESTMTGISQHLNQLRLNLNHLAGLRQALEENSSHYATKTDKKSSEIAADLEAAKRQILELQSWTHMFTQQRGQDIDKSLGGIRTQLNKHAKQIEGVGNLASQEAVKSGRNMSEVRASIQDLQNEVAAVKAHKDPLTPALSTSADLTRPADASSEDEPIAAKRSRESLQLKRKMPFDSSDSYDELPEVPASERKRREKHLLRLNISRGDSG